MIEHHEQYEAAERPGFLAIACVIVIGIGFVASALLVGAGIAAILRGCA